MQRPSILRSLSVFCEPTPPTLALTHTRRPPVQTAKAMDGDAVQNGRAGHPLGLQRRPLLRHHALDLRIHPVAQFLCGGRALFPLLRQLCDDLCEDTGAWCPWVGAGAPSATKDGVAREGSPPPSCDAAPDHLDANGARDGA